MAQAATPADTLVMAKNIDDMITLDPAEAYELTGIEIDTNIYDRIMRYDAEDVTKLSGGVAESWSVSDDGKTFTFKLRPGLKFQSGDTLTADDAAFSLQRVVKLDKTPAFLIEQLGWTKDNVDKMVKAVDPATLQFTISEDFSPSLVLSLMSSIVGSVVEKKTALAHEQNGDLGNTWLKSHTAGAGPYKLTEWAASDHVIIDVNPYAAEKALMHRIIQRHVADPSAQLLLLQKGDVDIARDLGSDQLKTIAGDSNPARDAPSIDRSQCRLHSGS